MLPATCFTRQHRNICAFRIINVLSWKEKKVRLLAKKWWGKPYNNTQSKFKTGFCLTSLSLSNCVENSSYKSDYSIFSFASFSTDTFFAKKKTTESFQESITCDESKLGQHTTIKAVSQTFWKAISKVLSYAGKESTLHTEAKCSVNVNTGFLWSIWSKSFMW